MRTSDWLSRCFLKEPMACKDTAVCLGHFLMLPRRFSWVFFQLEVLRKCSLSSVRSVLAELPESLDETYERILQQIPGPDRVHVYRLLQCLVVAAYPLKVEDLAEILAIDFFATGMTPILDENSQWEDKERAVLSACSSLITIVQDRGSRLVQFSHLSVKEFLTSNHLAASTVETLRYHHIALEPAHMMMTISCLKIMQQGLKFNICGLKSSYKMNYQVEDIFALVDRCIPSYLAYACQYWANHLRGIASGEKRDTDIVNLLRNFLNFHLLYWLEALSLLSRSHIASKSLLIAAEWLEVYWSPLSTPDGYILCLLTGHGQRPIFNCIRCKAVLSHLCGCHLSECTSHLFVCLAICTSIFSGLETIPRSISPDDQNVA